MMTSSELAERMKAEILADVEKGIVPASVSSFSELHEYVDANLYGGTEALLEELDSEAPDTDEGHSGALAALCDLANPAMNAVDAWIRSGGIAAGQAAKGMQ
ncbi:MAG: hypothetical protein KF769_15110 [Parvibaculum sp.]|nr:hypothetical protein [Parvibaculum sp.]